MGPVALALLVLASILFVRAHLAYASGFAPTNLPCFNAVLGLFPSEPRPAGIWRVVVNEERLTLGLALLSMLSAIASLALATRARYLGGPSVGHAGIAALALGTTILAARQIAWLWPLD